MWLYYFLPIGPMRAKTIRLEFELTHENDTSYGNFPEQNENESL